VNDLTFEYTAYSASGVMSRGRTEASSKHEAFGRVQAMGLTPVNLRAVRARSSRGWAVASKDLAHFTYQLSVLLDAKIPLAEGLSSIAEQEREGPLREIVEDVARRVKAGEGVASALGVHRAAFGEVFVESVRASERTGTLGTILNHLAEMLERSQEATRQVRGALLYPASVAVVLALASIFLVGVVVPRFGEMFAKRGVPLPLLTRIVMDVGMSVRTFWWAYGIAVIGCLISVRWLWTSERGKRALDRVAHRIPYVSRIIRGLGISRFARVLGIGLSSGLGLIEALTLAGKASGRPMIAMDTDRMARSIQGGERFAACLQKSDYFPLFGKRMLVAGDQSGEMARMCDVVARHYERECQHLTKDLSSVLEPIMIVGIAGVVLVVALSIFLPMWDMAHLVGA
jgi:type IV pilus assembly protein PilC